MASPRTRKIEAEMQRVLAELIARDVRDPRVGNVTITAVRLAADLSHARVYFTPFVLQSPPEEVRAGLTRAGGFLRGEVGRRLGLRHAPRLEFLIDDSPQAAAHLSSLIDQAGAADRAAAEEAKQDPPTDER
jgi:ribosome-binding factor A